LNFSSRLRQKRQSTARLGTPLNGALVLIWTDGVSTHASRISHMNPVRIQFILPCIQQSHHLTVEVVPTLAWLAYIGNWLWWWIVIGILGPIGSRIGRRD
jgi:hypothetical protein